MKESSKGQSEAVNRRTDNIMTKRKGTKRQTMIYITLHRKIKIEQHEPYWKLEVNWGAPEGWAVSVPHVAPVVLLLLQTRWQVVNKERTGLRATPTPNVAHNISKYIFLLKCNIFFIYLKCNAH